MSDSDDSALPDSVRSVTAPSDTHPDAGMNAIGWIIFGGLLFLLLPVLPLLAVIWLFDKARTALRSGE
jgi:hypothetical protein